LAILLLAKFISLLHPSTISRIKLSPPAVASERLSVKCCIVQIYVLRECGSKLSV
jgi:hypothetical protein